MGLIEYDNVIQKIAPTAFDPPFRYAVLPRTVKRGSNRADGHRPYCYRDLQSILGIPIKDEISGSRLIREGLAQLLQDPTGSGMGRNVEMRDTPSTVADDEETIEHTESDGRDREEIHRRNHFAVVA